MQKLILFFVVCFEKLIYGVWTHTVSNTKDIYTWSFLFVWGFLCASLQRAQISVKVSIHV